MARLCPGLEMFDAEYSGNSIRSKTVYGSGLNLVGLGPLGYHFSNLKLTHTTMCFNVMSTAASIGERRLGCCIHSNYPVSQCLLNIKMDPMCECYHRLMHFM